MLEALLLLAVLLLASYLYVQLDYKRFRQYASIPQPPSNLILGHLKLMGDYMERGPKDAHPDVIFSEMYRSLGRPDLMLVDLRPVNRPMVMVSNHDIAEQITRTSKLFPTSPPKSPLGYLEHVIGSRSILALHGEPWRELRKRFNPGFAPQHLMTLLPQVLEKVPRFVENLDVLARTGEDFPLVPLIINLTFDVIGTVVLDVDLEAQPSRASHRPQGEIVRLFAELLTAYDDDMADLPWWLIPRTHLKRRRLGKRIDRLVKDIVRSKYNSQQQQRLSNDANVSRSILSLSFQDSQELTPELLDSTSDQVRSFLFAGHDTTSIMLAWVFYELSRTPHAKLALRAELDSIFGPNSDPSFVQSRLLSFDGPDLVRRMRYISATIKEALRLHPPAATARMTPPGTGLIVKTSSGEEYCLDNMIINIAHTIIQRDRTVYGQTADSFVPERWLDPRDGGLTHAEHSSGIPTSAWRPFERGPRNCIGQEFAMIEARVVIAVVARQYEFTKVGLGETDVDVDGNPVLEPSGQFKVKSELYNRRQVTMKPVDGMRMRVKTNNRV